jgi:D-aspartate ligase
MSVDGKLNTGRPAVFVLGGGLITLGILRRLGRRGVPITVFHSAPRDLTDFSRFCRVVRVPRAAGEDAVVQRVVDEARQHSIKPVLIVAGDDSLGTACRHRAALEPWLDFVLPDSDTAETVLDKDSFAEFAASCAVPTPRTWTPSTADDLDRVLAEVPRDTVLKPRRSLDWHAPEFTQARGHIKMIRASGLDELRAEWLAVEALAGPPIVQEYVAGGDDAHFSYVSYRDRSGAEVVGVSVQKLRLNPVGAGLSSFACVRADAEVEATGRRVLDELRYRGVASVCFKRDTTTGALRLFEINGRLPLCHGALLLAEVDLPWIMYRDGAGLPQRVVTPLPDPHGFWVTLTHDVWSFRDHYRAGSLAFIAWIWSLAATRVAVEFDFEDRGPFFAMVHAFGRQMWQALRSRS